MGGDGPAVTLGGVEQQAVPEVSSRVLTIPNLLSFLRLLLVPVFLVLIVVGQEGYALLVLVVSSVTDYLDGQLARRLKQVTRLGQLLDPAADRLFIFAALVGLTVRGVVPWWLFAVILGRELLLVVLGLVLAHHGYGPLSVHHLGKTGTFCLLFALPILLLGQAFPVLGPVAQPVGWAFALWGTFVYWWAGAVYLRETVRLVRIPLVDAASGSDTLER